MVPQRQAGGHSRLNQEATDLWARALQAFQTAKRLSSTDPDASSSRSYYAPFYAVSALFVVEGKTFTRHSALEISIHRDLVRTGRWPTELGEDYAFLLRLRSTGDYGGHMHVSPEEADDAVRAARRILQAVRQASPQSFTDLESD